MNKAKSKNNDAFRMFMGKYGIGVILIFMIAIIAVMQPRFIYPSNILNILTQISVNCLIAYGMCLAITTGGIDLSVGSQLALVSCLLGVFIVDQNMNIFLACLLSVAAATIMGFVNGVLRSVLRQRDEVRLRPWEELALPKNLYEYFLDRYGKKTTKKLANAFLERQPEVTIHIDSNKISVREYEEHLQSCNLQYASGHYMRDSFLIRHCEDVRSLSGYEEGWFFVQDESSMLAVLCADIQSGDTVVDVCASPGGKSMHALLRMNGQGFLSYRDISEKKLSRVRENLRRLQYTNAKGKVWDGTRADREWRERADVVLADVPCSGMGIIGKKPEIKYHALQKVEKLVPLQREICQASLTMLRKGGVFLYSTCTICEKENEENVMWLEEHCGLKRESLDAFLPEELQNKMTAQGMIQMLPGIHKSDGFFVARFRKV